jgi:hypothetical protein
MSFPASFVAALRECSDNSFVTCIFTICAMQAELLQAARRLRSGPTAAAIREAPVGEDAVGGGGSSRESLIKAEPPLPRRNMNIAPQLPPRKKQESRKNPNAHWEM